jgi:hypothetical protein
MRWVSVLAAGYAINQMLAFTDPTRLASLAEPPPGALLRAWRWLSDRQRGG